MGWYAERVLPRVIDKTCGMPAMRTHRARTCAPLSGRVIEIGFGSGTNLGCYPDAVTEVTGIEPSDTAWRLAVPRIDSSSIPVVRGGFDGQRLEFDDDSFDAALSAFTMCTVPDLPAALSELARVVKPGGALCILEHGRAPDAPVRRWQRRLEPIQRRVAGGCHLTRDIPAEIERAGWQPAAVSRFYAEQAPRVFVALSLASFVNRA